MLLERIAHHRAEIERHKRELASISVYEEVKKALAEARRQRAVLDDTIATLERQLREIEDRRQISLPIPPTGPQATAAAPGSNGTSGEPAGRFAALRAALAETLANMQPEQATAIAEMTPAEIIREVSDLIARSHHIDEIRAEAEAEATAPGNGDAPPVPALPPPAEATAPGNGDSDFGSVAVRAAQTSIPSNEMKAAIQILKATPSTRARPGELPGRVLEYLRANPGPWHVREIARALELTERQVANAARIPLRRGEIERALRSDGRRRKGIYQAIATLPPPPEDAPPPTGPEAPAPAEQPDFDALEAKLAQHRDPIFRNPERRPTSREFLREHRCSTFAAADLAAAVRQPVPVARAEIERLVAAGLVAESGIPGRWRILPAGACGTEGDA